MPTIGVSELILVIIIAVLVLKPEQMGSAWLQVKRALFKVRQYTNTLEQEYIQEQKQKKLADRIAQAAKVSDVSDLMNDHES